MSYPEIPLVCRAARHDFAFAFPFEGKLRPQVVMRCSAPARLCRQMLHFASLTEISRLRRRLKPLFLSRRKKKREKERPLSGLRREVRFVMSPPGKRRHNELNAAPPPETPRRTGKPGETNNRDVVHSGESFCVRGKNRSFSLPLEGKVPEGRMRCRFRLRNRLPAKK